MRRGAIVLGSWGSEIVGRCNFGWWLVVGGGPWAVGRGPCLPVLSVVAMVGKIVRTIR